MKQIKIIRFILLLKTEGQDIFNVRPYLELEAFADLRKQDAFQKISNGRYFIEWDCGADLSADTIEAQLKTA